MVTAFCDQPKIELVRNQSFADYCATPGVNNSSLSWFDEWSGGAPAKYKFYAEHPELRPEPTAALEDGSCYHHFVLQPDSFDRFYVVRTAEIEAELLAVAQAGQKSKKSEKFSASLGVYKDWARCQQAEGRLVITQKRADELHWMRDALLSCKEVREEGVFDSAELELSAFCGFEFQRGDYAGRRLQLKARFDIVGTGDALIDLKTARTAHREEFSRQCWKLSYNRQAAFYTDVANANGLGKKRFGFLAQDKTAPYLACIHFVDGWLAHGRRRYEVILSQLAASIGTGRWQGYESGELMPPSFAQAELEAAA